jgi:hypothetical protein
MRRALRLRTVRAGAHLLVAWLVTAMSARADGPESESLVQRGVELRRERRDAEALAAFREAYAKEPTPRTLAQIGLAEQALGSWVAAEEDLVRALADTRDAWIAKHAEGLARALEAVRTHLADLEVVANVPDAEVWIDGARIGSIPSARAFRVIAGHVELEVRAPGHPPLRRDLETAPGATAHEEVAFEPPAPPPAPTPLAAIDAPTPPRSRASTVAWSLLGAGGALAAEGASARTSSPPSARSSSTPTAPMESGRSIRAAEVCGAT